MELLDQVQQAAALGADFPQLHAHMHALQHINAWAARQGGQPLRAWLAVLGLPAAQPQGELLPAGASMQHPWLWRDKVSRRLIAWLAT